MNITPLSALISSLSLNHHRMQTTDHIQLYMSFYPSDLDANTTLLHNALHCHFRVFSYVLTCTEPQR